MEPNYKEIAEDLRYHYDKFIELWQKARKQGLSVALMKKSSGVYDNLYVTDPCVPQYPLELYIQRTESF